MRSRKRVGLVVLLTTAALVSASMLAPAFGAPKAVSAASVAKKLARTLKIAKRADRNAKRAIAGLQAQGGGGQGGPGATGPAGPKGDTGATGARGATGAKGAPGEQGAKGDPCPSSDVACHGPQGDPGQDGQPGQPGQKGDPCLSSDPACKGPQGDPGQDGQPGEPGPSAMRIDVAVDNGFSDSRTLGPFSMSFVCSGDSAHRAFTFGAGGSGGAQLSGVKSIDDLAVNTIPFAAGAGLPTGQAFGIGVGLPNGNNSQGHFYRLGGTLVLHNGLTVTTIVFDAFLENRQNQGQCLFRGTAVQSGLIV